MNNLIVITGGSKGIGKAIIERFAKEGFEIITCARSLEGLQNLEKDLKEKFPALKLHYKAIDMSVKKEVLAFAAFVKSFKKNIKILVNNAGVFIPGEIAKEEEGALEKMINTNLYSAYHLTRELLPEIIAQKESDIFNICSIASQIAYPNGGSYSISKFALYGFSKVLREELKEKAVRVIAVLPGATLTASWEGVDIPEERFMKAEDVAESIWLSHSLSRNTVIEELILRPQLGDL